MTNGFTGFAKKAVCVLLIAVTAHCVFNLVPGGAKSFASAMSNTKVSQVTEKTQFEFNRFLKDCKTVKGGYERLLK